MTAARRGLPLLAAAAVVLAACGSGAPAAGIRPATSTLPATVPATTSPPATTVPATIPPTTTPPTTAPTTTAAPTTTTACVQIGSWPDARLAAETVIVPADETDLATAGPAVAAGAGGVVLFGASAPADLGSQISGLERQGPSGLGLLVMADEEGGGVQRMANLAGSLPWAAAMGADWSPGKIESAVAAVAGRMAALGVDVDLGPVVDVDGRDVPPGSTDPDGWRSFGGSVALVQQDGAAFAAGLHDGGVVAVAKHFPGLGGSTGNTDEGPADTLPWSTLQHSGLLPFVAAVRAGVPAIMVSNAVVPGLTTLPASLSPAAVAGELEGALGFRGLVITDSLSAGAISAAGYTVTAAAVQGLRAGDDMVMFTSTDTAAATLSQLQAIESAVTAAVAGGSLPRSRLLAAAGAVLSVRGVPHCG